MKQYSLLSYTSLYPIVWDKYTVNYTGRMNIILSWFFRYFETSASLFSDLTFGLDQQEYIHSLLQVSTRPPIESLITLLNQYILENMQHYTVTRLSCRKIYFCNSGEDWTFYIYIYYKILTTQLNYQLKTQDNFSILVSMFVFFQLEDIEC
ncbi:Hypothetical_protein [Hexamita inflata]|uniref:Hypothetical_protein n=1 Tax=Hexamita inflata TaxID=28002 RepID=A0AA86UXZ0_9EUKA|nr:Hypothetical protein HINF_LOCUS60104 [Hexamita inflata]